MKKSKVDVYPAVSGCQQSQCTSRCFLLPSGNVLTPGVALRSRSTKGSRNAPYGRLAPDGIISTVFVEPEWRRLALIHPNQPRLMTVRELARVQVGPAHTRRIRCVLTRQ